MCPLCALGMYCPDAGMTDALACSGGRYGSTLGQSSSLCSGECTAGYFCPNGSTSPTQTPCPNGTSSDKGAAVCASKRCDLSALHPYFVSLMCDHAAHVCVEYMFDRLPSGSIRWQHCVDQLPVYVFQR